MKHLEIRDLSMSEGSCRWEVEGAQGRWGDKNPCDLMTKVLGLGDILRRLDGGEYTYDGEGNMDKMGEV